jgi:predicted 3-demethylubiquinone-9 3-methyltransferase (glyoxalase superfamily)
MWAVLAALAGAPISSAPAWEQDRFAISFWVRPAALSRVLHDGGASAQTDVWTEVYYYQLD